MRFLQNEKQSVLIDYVDREVDTNAGFMNCWYHSTNYLRVVDKSQELDKLFESYSIKSSKFDYRRQVRAKAARDLTDLYSEEVDFQRSFLKRFFSMSEDAITVEFNRLASYINRRRTEEPAKFDECQATYILHNIILAKFRDAYGMKYSSWHPADSFSQLMDELKLHGPLYTQGHFHPEYYTAPSEHRGVTFGGKEVYQYPQGSVKSQILAAEPKHGIVIVGAKKGETKDSKDLVFYIDPSERIQRLHVMSYKLLQEKVFNARADSFSVTGINLPTQTQGPFLITSKDYGLVQEFYRPELRAGLT